MNSDTYSVPEDFDSASETDALYQFLLDSKSKHKKKGKKHKKKYKKALKKLLKQGKSSKKSKKRRAEDFRNQMIWKATDTALTTALNIATLYAKSKLFPGEKK